jgi:hypothetical protein
VSGTFSGTLITDDGQGSNVALSGSFSVPVTNSASSESAAVRKLIYVRQSR